MIQVVYVSTEARPLTSQALTELLRTSRANNAERSVSGLLLYQNGDFMQVLEGEEQAVDDLVATIKADDRHQDITVLSRRVIGEREFGNWSMAFENVDALSEEDAQAHSDFLSTPLTAEDFADDPGRARQLLTHFKSKLRRGVDQETGRSAA